MEIRRERESYGGGKGKEDEEGVQGLTAERRSAFLCIYFLDKWLIEHCEKVCHIPAFVFDQILVWV